MYSLNKSKLLKVLSLNSISVAISFLLGIFSTKIVSVFLGTQGMALLGSFRNFSTMLKNLSTLGINNSIVKLLVENKNDKKELSIIYSTFFWIFITISFFLCLIILLFSSSISSFIFYTDKYSLPIIFFGLMLPLIVINTFWIAIYNGLEMFKKIVSIQIFSNILVFTFTTLLIYYNNILGSLFAVTVGELVMVLVTFIYIRRDKDYFKFDLQKLISKKYFDTIKRFSTMALLSAIVGPLTLMFIRNIIVNTYSIEQAGIWDAINRLSGFYMLFLSTGLSMYYLPRLASLSTDSQFKNELKYYFKTFVPIFLIMIVAVYLFKNLILKIAFTAVFSEVNTILIWQLLGDFFKIMTLAFGYQILIKTMMKRYFLVEIIFNSTYILLSYFLINQFALAGVVQAYFFANVITFLVVLWMFRKLLLKAN